MAGQARTPLPQFLSHFVCGIVTLFVLHSHTLLCVWQVVVYHGAKRAADLEQLTNADVVLTTYSVLENEYRK